MLTTFLLISPKLHESWSKAGDRLLDNSVDFVTAVLPKLLVVAALAWILIRLVSFFSSRMIRIAERHAGGAIQISQARTLSSVIRATGIAIIAFLAVLQILPMLGFNLGPLLTSAGVAGVAIGLAAQTIVKDCLNGTLILIEDQYNVGDWVTIAGFTGQIEGLSLRKTTLRDGNGTLYVIPNSQITTVANLTRDYSSPVLNVAVDYSADPDKTIAVLTEVAKGVRNDPAFKDAFLADPVILGVDQVKGSQLIYPIVLKTLANQQWGPLRELQRRIRLALPEHSILPGDPYRVFGMGNLRAGAVPEAPAQPEAPHPNPTAAKPQEINPFTGEGL
ncbi:MAG TPA: mechanosensitive ion channel family protein [Acidobacteriaceae bacterium]|nr:mechanosensitive ion channel family protein [Acidobacteriaceae bacterium]